MRIAILGVLAAGLIVSGHGTVQQSTVTVRANDFGAGRTSEAGGLGGGPGSSPSQLALRAFLPLAFDGGVPHRPPPRTPGPGMATATATSTAPIVTPEVTPTPTTGSPGEIDPTYEYITNLDRPSALAIDPVTGHVWAVGGGGVAEWDPSDETVRGYTFADGLTSLHLSSVAAATDGRVWVGTRGDGPMVRAPGAGFSPFSIGEGEWLNDVLAVDLDPDGGVWFGTGAGPRRVAPDGTVEDAPFADLVVSTARDGAGNRWFAKYFDGLVRMAPDGRLTEVNEADGVGLTNDEVLRVVAAPDGAVWVLSMEYSQGGQGVIVVPAVDMVDAGGRWTTLDTSSWVSDTLARDVSFDAAGGAWIATDKGILTPSGGASELAGIAVADVEFDARGELWAATANGLARRGSTGEWRTLSQGGLAGSNVWDIALETNGTAWIGAGGGGLQSLGTDGTWRKWDQSSGLYGDSAGDLSLDGSGGVWFSAPTEPADEGGVVHLSANGVLTGYQVEDGLASAEVTAIEMDGQGAVWIASNDYYYAPGLRRDGGVSVLEPDGSWRVYYASDGLPLGGGVMALAIEEDGTAWAGTRVITGAPEECLARMVPGGTWEIVATPPEVSSRGIEKLALDPAGTLWVVTTVGIFRRGRDGTWTRPADDPELGLRANALERDGFGRWWFAVADGLRVLHPDGRWESIDRARGMLSTPVDKLAVGPDGRVWTASGGVITVVTP